jgi:hypothetical protein
MRKLLAVALIVGLAAAGCKPRDTGTGTRGTPGSPTRSPAASMELQLDKSEINVKPEGKEDVRVTRTGGDMKALDLDAKADPDSKLKVTGGKFKDGDKEAMVTVEAPKEAKSGEVTVSAGGVSKKIKVNVKE